jgi:hypothetical protein
MLSHSYRNETADHQQVLKHLLSTISVAHAEKLPIIVCIARKLSNGLACEHGRLNLDDYATAISMVGNLLHMVVAGTGVSPEQALDDLKDVLVDFQQAYSNGASER